MFLDKLHVSSFLDMFPHNAWTVALSAHSDFVGSRVCSRLGVTCHRHFWQNDRALLRATAVKRGLNGSRRKNQHTKLTLAKKFLPPLLPGFEVATFRSRVRRSNQQAIPASTGNDLTNISAASPTLQKPGPRVKGQYRTRM